MKKVHKDHIVSEETKLKIAASSLKAQATIIVNICAPLRSCASCYKCSDYHRYNSPVDELRFEVNLRVELSMLVKSGWEKPSIPKGSGQDESYIGQDLKIV